MSDFEFLHAADIHLDSPLNGLARYDDFPLDLFRDAPRRALENLVQLAIDRSVAFVLLAGDLYDGQWDDSRTGFFLAKQLGRLREAQIPVIAIHGNHDAANQMSRHIVLPETVKFLRADHPESVELDNCPCVVHGQSFAQREARENLALRYPASVPGKFNIGLLHTSLDGRPGHAPYAPCSINDLVTRGYDYWALGHIHLREIVHAEPPIVYPGNLQGRHARELGAKGAYIVSVQAQRPTLEFVELDVVRWMEADISIDSLITPDDFLDELRSKAQVLRDESNGRTLAVRIQITGRGPLHRVLAGNPKRWDDEIRGVLSDFGQGSLWLEKVRRRTSDLSQPNVSLDDGPLSVMRQLIDQMRANPEEQAALKSELAELLNRLPANWAAEEDANKGEAELIDELLAESLPLVQQLMNEME